MSHNRCNASTAIPFKPSQANVKLTLVRNKQCLLYSEKGKENTGKNTPSQSLSLYPSLHCAQQLKNDASARKRFHKTMNKTIPGLHAMQANLRPNVTTTPRNVQTRQKPHFFRFPVSFLSANMLPEPETYSKLDVARCCKAPSIRPAPPFTSSQQFGADAAIVRTILAFLLSDDVRGRANVTNTLTQ